MRHLLRPRVPVALLSACAVCGCAVIGSPLGSTATGPVSYQVKVKKVATMTKTFSLSGNQGLGQVALSLKDLATSLQSAFAAGSAVSASQGVAAITSTGLRATYDLAGVSQQGDSKLIYDDVTKELTGVKGPDAELAFKFVNKGRTRSWQVTIVHAKDGTTGTLSLEVTGGWASQPTGGSLPFVTPPTTPLAIPPCPVTPEPLSYPTAWPSGYGPNDVYVPPSWGPSSYPTYAPSWGPSAAPSYAPSYRPTDAPTLSPTPAPSYAPTPTPRPSYAVMQASEPEVTYCDAYPQQSWTPPPPPSPPPFKVFGGEYPNVVEAVHLSVDLKPRGDEKLGIKLDGQFNEPEAFPGTAFLVPTHWVVKASVPSVALDWESHLHLDPGKSSFKGGGSLTADTPDGAEKFLYDLSVDEAAKTGTFNLTNVAGKVRLQVVGSMGSSQPDASLISTEDGKHLGKVTLDPSRPRFAKVQLDDGTSLDWELFPDNLIPVAPLPAPAP